MKVDLAVEGCVSLITYHGSCVRFYWSTAFWCPAILIFIPGFWYRSSKKAGDRFTGCAATLLRCDALFIDYFLSTTVHIHTYPFHYSSQWHNSTVGSFKAADHSSVSVLAFHIDCIALLALTLCPSVYISPIILTITWALLFWKQGQRCTLVFPSALCASSFVVTLSSCKRL
jgi:hypothetical protein